MPETFAELMKQVGLLEEPARDLVSPRYLGAAPPPALRRRQMRPANIRQFDTQPGVAPQARRQLQAQERTETALRAQAPRADDRALFREGGLRRQGEEVAMGALESTGLPAVARSSHAAQRGRWGEAAMEGGAAAIGLAGLGIGGRGALARPRAALPRLPAVADEVPRLPLRPVQEIGANALPIRARQPFRQAEVGGSGDLAGAAEGTFAGASPRLPVVRGISGASQPQGRGALSAAQTPRGLPRVGRNVPQDEGALARGDTAERGVERFYDPRLSATRNKAVEMSRNNYTNAEIADELDTTESVVKVYLSNARKLGIDVPTASSGYTSGARTGWSAAQLYKMSQRGFGPTLIAERTGLPVTSINNQLSRFRRQLGVSAQQQQSRAGSVGDWDARQRAGESYAEIARSAGVKKEVVSQAVYRYRGRTQRDSPATSASPRLPVSRGIGVFGRGSQDGALTPRELPRRATENRNVMRENGVLESSAERRLPRAVADITTPRGETHETIRNPSEADIMRLTKPGRVAQESAIERGVAISSSRGVRYIKDAEGNIYIGNSYDMTHHDLVTYYGLPNRGLLDGGEIVRLPDGTLELQNNDGAMPLPRGWLNGRS